MSAIKSLILLYLRIAARIQLFKIKPAVIGVGGSSGKSSTAGFIEAILKSKYSVLGTGGKNSETGIPLSILGIKIKNYSKSDWIRILLLVPVSLLLNWKKYDFLVGEMGIDSPLPPKNMAYLLKILSPTVAVLTNIDYEHSIYFEQILQNKENLGNKVLDLISDEELSLLDSLPKSGVAVINWDDPRIREAMGGIKSLVLTVSTENPKADFYIQKIDINESSFIVEFINKGRKHVLKLKQPLPSYFAYSFVLSIATCQSLGVDSERAVRLIEKTFSLPPGRASVFDGVKNTKIIDSSYNSSLNASVGMLELLSKAGQGRRRVAIIGDMREQGLLSKRLHEKLAEGIISGSDYAILIGPLTREHVSPYLDLKDFPHKSFISFSEAKAFIRSSIKERDLILVKGSQNTLFLERVVEMLLKDKSDISRLPRRGVYWDEIRAKAP